LYKGDKLQTINFIGEAREVAPFYSLQIPWKVGYFPLFLVILEYAVVTILYIVEKNHWMNDLLHITQFIAMCQLPVFTKQGRCVLFCV
jgi:hypothetical protein